MKTLWRLSTIPFWVALSLFETCVICGPPLVVKSHFDIYSAAESSHQVVLGMQEMFLLFLGDIDPLNPIQNNASAYMLSVLIFGRKKFTFWSWNMLLACSDAFTYILFWFVLMIIFCLQFLAIPLHAYCGLCIFSQKMWFRNILR